MNTVSRINSLKHRDPYFDIIKGIAILLVVAGHCIQYGNGVEYMYDKEYLNNIYFRAIYSFHMPLFMMICGYFFYSSASKRTLFEIICNKCQTVLLPILTFGILSYFIWEIPKYGDDSLSNIGTYLKDCSNHTRHSLWFFWALFKISIIVAVIQKGAKDNYFFHILVLLLVLFFSITKISELEKSVYPFFLLGYWAKKYNLWNKLQGLDKKFLLTTLGIIYSICLYYFHTNMYVYTTGVTIYNSDFGYIHQIFIDVKRMFIGFTGSLFCLILIKFVYKSENRYSCICLAFLGKFSGGIYCVHSALLPVDKFVSVLPETMNSGEKIFIPVLIYSICISWTLSKNKFTNYLFLGGR